MISFTHAVDWQLNCHFCHTQRSTLPMLLNGLDNHDELHLTMGDPDPSSST